MKDKEIRLLSHGLFEKPFMDSKVTSRSVSTKERSWAIWSARLV